MELLGDIVLGPAIDGIELFLHNQALTLPVPVRTMTLLDRACASAYLRVQKRDVIGIDVAGQVILLQQFSHYILFTCTTSNIVYCRSFSLQSLYEPTAPYHPSPRTAPNKMAKAGGTPNQAVSAYVTAATTTHQGSPARLFPSLLCGVKYPISHSLYTAVNTNPTAVALMPRSKLSTQAFVRKACQIDCTPTARISPGEKIATKASSAPNIVGTFVEANVNAPR